MASPSALPPKTARQSRQQFQYVAFIYRRLLAFLMPSIKADSVVPYTIDLRWAQVQEQVLTGLSRIGAVFGTLTLLVWIFLPTHNITNSDISIYVILLAVTWVLSLSRRLPYEVRAVWLLLCAYSISCTELLYYGLSQDAPIYFVFFSLLALLFFNLRVGITAILFSVTTIMLVGLSIGKGTFIPWAHPQASLSVTTVITTSMIFVMIVGSVQVGCVVLFEHLHRAWQNERHARTLLESERDLLEQRVAERTEALVQAHTQAVAATRNLTEQKEYLEALHQTALDLLNHREASDLLQAIVERATTILNAPYGELMLYDNEELVVHAFTQNQPFLIGDRVKRGEALLSWKAYDTQEPVLLDDYSTWSNHRSCYDEVVLRAVADFPIVAGQHSLGVLAMGRTEPGHIFTSDDIQKGLAFSRLAAVVLDNKRLYTMALREIAERKQIEHALYQQAEELRSQNVELDAFAHTVAHDLKNPLTSLLGYNQLLALGYSKMQPYEIDGLHSTVDSIGRKMNAIINALLMLASVRMRDAIPRDLLSMGEIIAEVENRLQEQIKATGACITHPVVWPDAVGYAPWIEEVWVNYISNALKYGGEPPCIRLGAESLETGFVRFWVQDNGPGLNSHQQEQLFTLFTRLHPERNEGHGLGLSIVQRIVLKLGGEVGVESTPGCGSTFFFTLPEQSHSPVALSDEPSPGHAIAVR